MNHKGTWCIYKPELFCQEGECSNCQIAQERQENMKAVLVMCSKCDGKELFKRIEDENFVMLTHWIGACKCLGVKKRVVLTLPDYNRQEEAHYGA